MAMGIVQELGRHANSMASARLGIQGPQSQGAQTREVWHTHMKVGVCQQGLIFNTCKSTTTLREYPVRIGRRTVPDLLVAVVGQRFLA